MTPLERLLAALRRLAGRLGGVQWGRPPPETSWAPVAERIDPAKCTPWPEGGVLVGGAVRDLLLGLAPSDFDWLVPDPAAAARRAADALGGGAFALDEARGHWRAVARLASESAPAPAGRAAERAAPGRDGDGPERGAERGAERETEAGASGYGAYPETDLGAPEIGASDAPTVVHDFAPLPERLEDDLAARDFTVDAIAARSNGALVDPFGGREDLARAQLRMVARANLEADPVRPLRAVRLATTLGFRLDPDTRAAVGEVGAQIANGDVERPAWERVGAELDRIVMDRRAGSGIGLLADLGLTAAFLPELEDGRGLEQGGFHHRDVLHHQIEALDRLVRGFPDADGALRWATLLHDVAKPATREEDDSGKITFYGHAAEGAEIAARMLRRLRFPEARVRRAAGMIREHMVQLPSDAKSARRFAHRRRELLPDLLALMLADREASRGPRSTEASRNAYRAAISRVLEARAATPERPPLLDGNEVMELLGLEPGPEVGRALDFVREAEAVGDVTTEAEAAAALRRYAAAQGWIEPEESTEGAEKATDERPEHAGRSEPRTE